MFPIIAPDVADCAVAGVKLQALVFHLMGAVEQNGREKQQPGQCCFFEICLEGAEIIPRKLVILPAHKADTGVIQGGEGRAPRCS